MAIGIFSAITIILLLAKVFDVIAISWFWVILPVIIGSIVEARRGAVEETER